MTTHSGLNSPIVSSNDETNAATPQRIDLAQFEGHGFREVITQNRHEYQEGFPPATVEVDVPEGIAFAPPPLDEKLVSWGGHKVWMSGKDAGVIQHIDSLISELKRCYDLIDKMQHSIVKNRGDCWDCDMPIDSCDARYCERQMLEDIELGTASE